ncbi:hypothetical protein D3M70_29150 [Pseudomonas sp. LS-2]|nr:hypothetical protein D3M70_29150 [Pseudomonas sp. LS-2]
MATPSSSFLNEGDAPWARRHPPSMAGGGSRGIHAARPTPRHLRSACTQVAIGAVWTIAHEDQDQDQDQDQDLRLRLRLRLRSATANTEPVAVRLAGGGDLECATASKRNAARPD